MKKLCIIVKNISYGILNKKLIFELFVFLVKIKFCNEIFALDLSYTSLNQAHCSKSETFRL